MGFGSGEWRLPQGCLRVSIPCMQAWTRNSSEKIEISPWRPVKISLGAGDSGLPAGPPPPCPPRGRAPLAFDSRYSSGLCHARHWLEARPRADSTRPFRMLQAVRHAWFPTLSCSEAGACSGAEAFRFLPKSARAARRAAWAAPTRRASGLVRG